MTAYRNAFSLPGDRVNRRVTRFGLYGADGVLLPHAQIETTPWQAQPAPKAGPAHDSSRLFGPALFAGPVDKQFGFILLNALGRLPALAGLPPHTTLVYAAKPTARVPDYAILPPILRSLGVHNPVLVTENPLHFQELYTAPDLFGESLGGTGKPAFYDWIDSRWPAPHPPDPEQRLYVTRSGLGPKAGRFACEDHLERLLQAEGYQIFAPEAHPIEAQVRAFQAAGKLIFAESSALHLFALLRKPGQISAVIQRRPTLPAIMQAQMVDRQGQPTVAINAITELWWPPQRGDHLGLSVLDFAQLRVALQAAGLITGQGWSAPDGAAVAASLRAGLEPGQDVMTTEHRAEWLRAKREKKG
ncbi:glycosyltransferase family 61 protein [Pseudotabrizicola sp. L79]|uniref:glycosyltransferase family 61 protein n=1 Tax=Pseudotabrizicola sp. L79 TaxID=3118402 RepID=UPI002F935456